MKNQQKKKHCCPHKECNASFSRPYRLAQHLLVHNNVKAYVCAESKCSKSYTSKSHLDRHINSVHRDPEKDVLYSCPTCMKRYANRQNLKRHIKVYHMLKVPFLCDICKMEFKKKNQLSAHMYQHTGIMSFSCEMCSKDFISLYKKKRHMRIHKTYECDQCDIKFSLWSQYQKHRKTDHVSKEYHCNDCGRQFKQRSHIVRHIKTHMQICNVKKKISCPYENCQRVYTRNANLKQHIIIKHVKLTHECTICDSQLSTKAKLNQHLKLHLQSEEKLKPKTLATGRKERKDKGSFKVSTALKLAGIKDSKEHDQVCNKINSDSIPILVTQ